MIPTLSSTVSGGVVLLRIVLANIADHLLDDVGNGDLRSPSALDDDPAILEDRHRDRRAPPPRRGDARCRGWRTLRSRRRLSKACSRAISRRPSAVVGSSRMIIEASAAAPWRSPRAAVRRRTVCPTSRRRSIATSISRQHRARAVAHGRSSPRPMAAFRPAARDRCSRRRSGRHERELLEDRRDPGLAAPHSDLASTTGSPLRRIVPSSADGRPTAS